MKENAAMATTTSTIEDTNVKTDRRRRKGVKAKAAATTEVVAEPNAPKAEVHSKDAKKEQKELTAKVTELAKHPQRVHKNKPLINIEGKVLATFNGIEDPKTPVTHEDVWNFVKEKAQNQPASVLIVPLENVALDSDRPIPFTNMARPGNRSKVMWMMVNGVGDEADHRMSTFLKEARGFGMSGQRCTDLVAALNGGYSQSSKSWGTPFVKLVVVKGDVTTSAKTETK
jgi:hypothetical protein